MFLKDEPNKPKTPYWIKVLETLPAFFMVIMGTACILAPMKMIKSVAIISANGSRTLRLEIKRALPFMKPDILETPASKVALDRNVPGFTEDIRINNIRIQEAKSFTEKYFSNSREAFQSGGVLGALSSFNRSLLSAWPATKREIRRMFTRDQMAYVRVEGNGNFKLDLQECSLLDQGRPLERIISTDPGERPSVTTFLRNLMGR